MNEKTIEINGAVLTEELLERIAYLQDEDFESLNETQYTLNKMLVEMVQMGFGGKNSRLYLMCFADVIELLSHLGS